jgi:hypothetical protein
MSSRPTRAHPETAEYPKNLLCPFRASLKALPDGFNTNPDLAQKPSSFGDLECVLTQISGYCKAPIASVLCKADSVES